MLELNFEKADGLGISLSQFSLVTGFLREREKIFYKYSGPQCQVGDSGSRLLHLCQSFCTVNYHWHWTLYAGVQRQNCKL